MSINTLVVLWIQGSALTFAAWLLCRSLKNARAIQLVCKVSLLLLIVMAVAPVLPLPTLTPSSAPTMKVDVQQSVARITRAVPTATSFVPTKTMLAEVAPSRPEPVDYTPWIGSIWLCGSAFLSLMLVAGSFKLAGIRAQSKPVGDYAGIALRESRSVSSPFVHGVLRPTIYVPMGWQANLDDDCRNAILEHEAGHVAGRDLWWMTIYRFATILLWPIIGLWSLQKTFHLTCEQVCDARVLRTGYAERTYAECLLNLKQPNPLPLAVGAVGNRSNFGRRITAILSGQRLRDVPLTGKIGLAASIGIVASISFTAIGTAVASPLIFSAIEQEVVKPGNAHFVGIVDFASNQMWNRDGKLIGKYRIDDNMRFATQGLGAVVTVVDGSKPKRIKTATGWYIDSEVPAVRLRLNGKIRSFGMIMLEDRHSPNRLTQTESRWQCIAPLADAESEGAALSDLQYGVASGPAKVMLTFKVTDGVLFTENSAVEMITGDSSKIFGEPIAGALADQRKVEMIYIQSAFGESDDIDVRFRAFDKKGQMLDSAGTYAKDPTAKRVFGFRGKLTDLGRIEVRTRDYKWFTVPRVALEPVATKQVARPLEISLGAKRSTQVSQTSTPGKPRLLGVVDVRTGQHWSADGKPMQPLPPTYPEDPEYPKYDVTRQLFLIDLGSSDEKTHPSMFCRIGTQVANWTSLGFNKKLNTWVGMASFEGSLKGQTSVSNLRFGVATTPYRKDATIPIVAAKPKPSSDAIRSIEDTSKVEKQFKVVTSFTYPSDDVDLLVSAFDGKGQPFRPNGYGSGPDNWIQFWFEGNRSDLAKVEISRRRVNWITVPSVALVPSAGDSK